MKKKMRCWDQEKNIRYKEQVSIKEREEKKNATEKRKEKRCNIALCLCDGISTGI